MDIIQGQQAHTDHTYNMGVHSCSATISWLYNGTHTGCAFALQYYHLQKGCVGNATVLAMGCTRYPPRFSPPGIACGAGGGTADFQTTTSGPAPTSPPEGQVWIPIHAVLGTRSEKLLVSCIRCKCAAARHINRGPVHSETGNITENALHCGPPLAMNISEDS